MTEEQKLTKIKMAIRQFDSIIERYQSNGAKPAVYIGGKMVKGRVNSKLGFYCVVENALKPDLRRSKRINDIMHFDLFIELYKDQGWLEKVDFNTFKNATNYEGCALPMSRFYKVSIPVLKGELPQRAEIMKEFLINMGLYKNV